MYTTIFTFESIVKIVYKYVDRVITYKYIYKHFYFVGSRACRTLSCCPCWFESRVYPILRVSKQRSSLLWAQTRTPRPQEI